MIFHLLLDGLYKHQHGFKIAYNAPGGCFVALGVDFGWIWKIFCVILADLARLERPLSLDIGCGFCVVFMIF